VAVWGGSAGELSVGTELESARDVGDSGPLGLPTALLSGAGAAAGIALIVAVGNLGGFAGPALTGVMEDSKEGSTRR
jgi:hypothetical protein